MTYVVLKGYLYDPIDCVKPAVAREPGKVYRKDSSFFSIILVFSIRLVLVSDPGSVSPFFRDELLCWHQPYILSLWTEEKGGSSGRGLYDERSKEL